MTLPGGFTLSVEGKPNEVDRKALCTAPGLSEAPAPERLERSRAR